MLKNSFFIILYCQSEPIEAYEMSSTMFRMTLAIDNYKHRFTNGTSFTRFHVEHS